jgi:hypothetical protein
LKPAAIIKKLKTFEDGQGYRFACTGYAGEKNGPTLIWQVQKPAHPRGGDFCLKLEIKKLETGETEEISLIKESGVYKYYEPVRTGGRDIKIDIKKEKVTEVLELLRKIDITGIPKRAFAETGILYTLSVNSSFNSFAFTWLNDEIFKEWFALKKVKNKMLKLRDLKTKK